ncbi:MAG: PqqD family peptide modification chaperone [Rhizomicrobium sp.]
MAVDADEMGNVAPLRPDSRVSRSGKMVEAEVNGEIVILHVELGTCYGLNTVGSRVWQLIASPMPVADIVAAIQSEYVDVPDDCERDVLELLDGLRSEGLVTVEVISQATAEQ